MTEALYRIGTAARLSGLSTHVIRVWERRYQALRPDRSEGGARLYSDADVERLRLLRRAVAQGHTIGQIAALPEATLVQLAGAEAPPAMARAVPVKAVSADGHSFARDFVLAVRDFDIERAERVLKAAALRFSPRVMVMDVLVPTLMLVGAEWARGELCVASEHLASALVRDRAGALLRECSAEPDAETIVLTTPAGEQHELGALLAAVMVAMSGFRAAYLGANLPASEIAFAARRTNAVAVALSLVALGVQEAKAELLHLQQELPRGTALLLGGANAKAVAAELRGPVDVHPSLAHLESWLLARKTHRPAGSEPA